MISNCANTLSQPRWPDDVSLRDDERFNFARVQEHNQITDLNPLPLAVRNRGCLVSFDQGIALTGLHGALPKHLSMLEAPSAVQAVTNLGTAASNCRV